jgi:hypothetical protein
MFFKICSIIDFNISRKVNNVFLCVKMFANITNVLANMVKLVKCYCKNRYFVPFSYFYSFCELVSENLTKFLDVCKDFAQNTKIIFVQP